VNLDEFKHTEEYKNKVWKLTDDERKKFHAGGVSYCYVGEDMSFAKELIEEAIQTHTILSSKLSTREK
jgi:HD superfamily phosphohydrolase YqeK